MYNISKAKAITDPRSRLPEIQRYEQFHWGEINPFQRIRDRDLFNNHTLWFAYGRQALRHGLKSLRMSAGDKVLVPAYICNVIESAFAALDLSITFYNVLEDTTPDFADIDKKIDNQTKALLAVNYYGLPAPIEAIKTFCEAHRLFFIEDNAQGFFGKKNDQRLGTFGDIGFTSVRKSIPMIHGAILNINPELGVPIVSPSDQEFNVSKSSTKYFLYYMIQCLLNSNLPPFPQIRKHQRKKINAFWGNVLQVLPDKFMEVSLNPFVPFIVQSVNYGRLLQNKRKKLKRVLTFLHEQSFIAGEIFIKIFPSEIIPFQVPFLLQDKQVEKNNLLTFLNRKGIEAFYWPDLPQIVVEHPNLYPMANYLKNNLIHFPI